MREVRLHTVRRGNRGNIDDIAFLALRAGGRSILTVAALVLWLLVYLQYLGVVTADYTAHDTCLTS